jgi:hypothetical protein
VTMASMLTASPERAQEMLIWLRHLPQMLIFGNVLLSHTGHGLQTRNQALWARSFAFPNDGYYRVFGHTPHRYPQILDTYACIDTGACFYRGGYGSLTAFQYPSMQVWQQTYDESVI